MCASVSLRICGQSESTSCAHSLEVAPSRAAKVADREDGRRLVARRLEGFVRLGYRLLIESVRSPMGDCEQHILRCTGARVFCDWLALGLLAIEFAGELHATLGSPPTHRGSSRGAQFVASSHLVLCMAGR